MAGFIKQKFGTENKIFAQEEAGFILVIKRAQNSTTNAQILGRNGEKVFHKFLNRYLPNCFRAVNGHFVTPEGVLSPEVDILLIDSRYPLISENEDGSGIVMLDSVLATIGVKLSLNKKEILTIRKHSKKISTLLSSVSEEKSVFVPQYEFAYTSEIMLETVGQHFFLNWTEQDPASDLYIMRIHPSDLTENFGLIGAQVWLEPDEKESFPCISTSKAPLSDFYYRLVQMAFWTLEERSHSFIEIGNNLNKYMTWGTYPNRYTEK